MYGIARYAGKTAGPGVSSDGRNSIAVNYKAFWAYRLAWKLMTGEEPPASIDHIDRNPRNNRWSNLRAAPTQRQQNWNQRRRKDNASGFRGVDQFRGRYRAQIKAPGIVRHLGVFDTIEEASAAYEAAARELHGEFYREPQP